MAVDEPWAEGLNPAQLAAVTHGAGPLLVVAGAGTGKTRTLAARVARLLAEGADPDRILLLTFSRRAAREMLQRAAHLGAERAASRVWGGTFHAVGNRLLHAHGPAVGLPPSFTILDQADAVDLMGLVRTDLELGDRGRRFPRKETLLDVYSRVANGQEPLADTLRERFPWCHGELDDIRRVFVAYAERKRTRGMLDYDDLLLYWRALVTAGPLADQMAARFDHVLVDEFQDTNLLQADIVAGLAPGGDGLFVVGDDAQAIYAFRAASAAAMSAFTERYPGIRVVALEENYRSVQPVLDLANGVLADAHGLHAKELRAARPVPAAARPVLAGAADEAAEASYVCDRVLEHREQGIALRDQAVLFRTGHHSARLEIELGRRHIPFVKYGGLKFLEAAHVKDLLAVLRLLENPSDELAWHRMLGLLDGIGPATTRAVVSHLGLPAPGATRRLVDEPVDVPVRARPEIDLLRELLRDCLDHPDAGAPAVEIELIRTHLQPLFERRYTASAARLADLEQLQQVAGGFTTRSQFLADLTIDPPARTSDLAGPPLLDDDYLVLSTIHSAKGGEWTAVFLIHAADGNIPSDMSLGSREGLEEERRLFYVAVTRARDHLHVIHPLRFYDHRHALDDRHGYAQPSRFVTGLEHLFDRPPPDQAALLADGIGAAGDPVGPESVTAALEALWSAPATVPAGADRHPAAGA